MSDLPGKPTESRQNPRLKLPAMYTLARVRPSGHDRYCWTGHIYDISENGMRIELDQAIEPGTRLEVRAVLPGTWRTTFHVTGHVVRLHDEDELGPVRMGLVFDRFARDTDHLRLNAYLFGAGLNAA